MRKFLLFGIVLASATLLTIELRQNRSVHAQAGCSVNSWKGPYSYLLNGFAYDSQGNLLVLGASGRIMPDGNGAVTGSDTLTLDGTIQRRTYTGTYTVNADCTGATTLTYSDGTKLSSDIVVTSNGREVNLIDTDQDVILSGVGKQQFPAQ